MLTNGKDDYEGRRYRKYFRKINTLMKTVSSLFRKTLKIHLYEKFNSFHINVLHSKDDFEGRRW